MCFLTTEYYYYKNKILNKDLFRLDKFNIIFYENNNLSYNFDENSKDLLYVNISYGNISNITFKTSKRIITSVNSITVISENNFNRFEDLNLITFESLQTGYCKYYLKYDKIY